ncbi:MAG TPA: ATP-binding protein [Bryobacteraceae bacterium]|jgi:signal transduction histidine kinase/CheY-like chemotaxis protein|nr:ATP-binding protein [Bryobacteraceae bacterium]
MSAQPHALTLKPILSVHIENEQDVVTARQRARQLSSLFGFDQQAQTRISTSVSEIARNAHRYAGGGRVDFSIDLQSRPQFLWIQVIDHGPGIRDLLSILANGYVSPSGIGLGILGTKRLMDRFQIFSMPGQGTTVRFGKALPANAKPVDIGQIGRLCAILAQEKTSGTAEELQRQNRDLLQTLDILRMRESELERRHQELARLNTELEETNRGVLALYAELDEQAIALKRADEIKSRFLSHVSHEFRTPTNAILALARLLIERADGDLTPEQEKQVLYIRDAAQQLADIVNDLLDLAKVESGKTEVHIARIDIGQFLGATRALMRPLAIGETVSLTFEETAPGLTVDTDECKLGQILRNLISNALKFTPEGEVRIVAKLSKSGDAVCFTVKDTGIGIAEQDQERIFQEFAQIDNPIQQRVKGTGLGLPLSRRLASLLGGTLTVESAIGSGATFTLTLPVTVSADSAAAGERKIGTSSDTILIVDDEATARYLARQLLRGTRFRTIEASGADAAERARFELPALILLDLIMSDRSGFEVLNDLKSDESTRSIPVVIHTSKPVTEADLARLGGRHLAILPKGEDGRLAALLAIREVLGEPSLFEAELEFKNDSLCDSSLV